MSQTPDLRIDALAPHHDRAGFSCGVDELDRYFKTQAGQDVRRKANGVFVLAESARPAAALGYYTLCAASLRQEGERKSVMPAHAAQTRPLVVANARNTTRYCCALRLDRARLDGLLGHAGFPLTLQGKVPAAARKHIPRYPQVSAILIGRLAVSAARQGQGLGAVLLADAVRRVHASASTIGASMMVVDAIDERAAGFYASHGFIRLPDSLRAVLPMQVIKRLAETETTK